MRISILYLEDLKPSNIQNANEGGASAESTVQRLVHTEHNPLEQTLVKSLGHSLAGKLNLRQRGRRGRIGRDEERERDRRQIIRRKCVPWV